jgi:hypothetical protein
MNPWHTRAGCLENAREREIVIGPEDGLNRYWGDFRQYRDLLAFLTWRDVLARYKQTVLVYAALLPRQFFPVSRPETNRPMICTLNSDRECLKVVDTFRNVVDTFRHSIND